MRFETVGTPVGHTRRDLNGRIVELQETPCQARKRDGEMCGRPSRQWMDGVGARCWRHREEHNCRWCVREVPA